MDASQSSKVVLHGDVACIQLGKGQKMRAEYGSTIGRNVSISTALTGEGNWLVTRLARAAYNKVLGGEGATCQWFDGPGEVLISDPLFPGRIVEFQLEAGEGVFMKKGAWLASDDGVNIAPTLEGINSLAVNALKGSIGKAWLLRAKAEVPGRVFLSSFGTIHHKELQAGESYRVDNTNLLAWTTGAKKSTTLAGGPINAVATGEGFEFAFEGPCNLFLESASKDSFLKSLVNTDGFMKLLVSSPAMKQHLDERIQPVLGHLEDVKKELADLQALQKSVHALKESLLKSKL